VCTLSVCFAQLRIAAGSCDLAITVLRVFLIQTVD
jgi:hypothetical protein